MDKGKSTMIGVEEYNDNNSSVKRHKSQTTPRSTTSDPSYKGRAPNLLLFYNKDGSPAFLPYPVATNKEQMSPHHQDRTSWSDCDPRSDGDPWLPVRWGRPVYQDGLWHFVVPTDGSQGYMDESTFY